MAGRRRQHDTTAIVVRLRNYADAHRIVELLTPTTGRVSALARGARASKRRFAGALDLFVSLRVQLVEGQGLWTLNAADIIALRIGIRSSLARLTRANILVEIARELSPEQQQADAVYLALERALDHLDRGEINRAAEAYPRFLVDAGILPASLAVPPEVRAVFAGAPCEDDDVASRLEVFAAELVEGQLGRPLKTRRAFGF